MAKNSEQSNNEEQRDLRRVPEPLRPHCFKPGQSGNPGGRPRGTVSLLRRLLKQLAQEVPGKPGVTYAEAIVRKLLEEATRNPLKAWPVIKEIIDREDGKVPNEIRAQLVTSLKDFVEQVEQERAAAEAGEAGGDQPA